MEASPLTQQSRPDSFEPKIVQLYLHLFSSEDEVVPSEGFWRELFLLPADKSRICQILEPLTPDDLVHLQTQTRNFFQRAVSEAISGVSPRNENALETLTGFLGTVLAKRFTNPSTDVIEVLAGLDGVDKLVSDLVHGLEAIIRTGTNLEFRKKAIVAALALSSSAYQTTLVSYFTHRDYFPALMSYVQDAEDRAPEAFLLLGLLSNYNKFEIQNPYQNRLDDFINEAIIHRIVRSAGQVYATVRDAYVTIQDDVPEGWSLNSTLTMIGLRALSNEPKTRAAPLTEEESKAQFGILPPPEISLSLPTYSFVHANNLFASALATLPPVDKFESPFASFLSCTSYLAHHAHRSPRAMQYAVLNLLTVRVLVEDPIVMKRICSSDTQVMIRLCRQRPPHLPLTSSARSPTSFILDVCTDTLSHNLRRRLDVPLYSLVIGIILRIVSHCAQTRTRLPHPNWAYVWGSIFSLLRFLTTYAADLKPFNQIRDELCTPLASLIAFSISASDSFLPTPADYDDLFYKLLEAGPVIAKFHDLYCDSSISSTSNAPDQLRRANDVLVAVSTHYHDLLQNRKKARQSPAAVQKVIREGYETLSLDMGGAAEDDFGRWQKWRESEWKPEIKRIVRTVVEDARLLALN